MVNQTYPKNLGYVLSEDGQFDNAIEMLRNASRTNPGLYQELIERGMQHKMQGEDSEALESVCYAIVIESNNINALRLWGGCLFDVGSYKQTETVMQRYVDLVPTCVHERVVLALAQAEQKNLAKAIESFDRISAINSWHPVAKIAEWAADAMRGLRNDATDSENQIDMIISEVVRRMEDAPL